MAAFRDEQPDEAMTDFTYRVRRSARLKSLMLSRLLRKTPFDFVGHPRVVALVGDYIGDQIRARGRYEDDILRLLECEILPRGSAGVALDIGANIGNHSLFLALRFDRVIAFEPNPTTRRLLEFNLALNATGNVDVRPVGLSNRSGSERLITHAGNLGASRIGPGTAVEAADEVTIQLVQGDEQIGSSCDVAFIKLDVEGHEHEALQGLRATIERCQPIILIEQLADVIDPVTGSSPSHDLLRDLGYQAFEVRPGQSNPLLRGLAELVTGRVSQRMVRVDRLEPRDHPALLFMPGR